MERQAGTFSGTEARAGLLFVLAFVMSGCGGNGASTATVTGTVTYRGAPVPAGRVSFYGPNDQVASAILNEDGSYEAQNVPLGSVKVAVSTPLPPPPEIQKAAKEGKRRFGKGNLIQAPANVVTIPPKYNDPAKSGLRVTVTPDAQPFLIDLK
jgi:hypothetical protein